MTGPIAKPHRRQPLPQRRASEMFELRHGGKAAVFHVTLGRYPDGRVGEVFITGSKSGSDLEANVRDTAILVSLALQHGVPLATMAAAITREADGSPSTVIGVVLDKLMRGQPRIEGAQP
jgi:ribonucleoside-diphosphate reductase alpha chain